MTQDNKSKRLSKVARELNVGISTIVEFLNKKGIDVKGNPNSKINPETYGILLAEYNKDGQMKKESEKLNLGVHRSKREVISINKEEEQALTDSKDVEDKAKVKKDEDPSKDQSDKKKDSDKPSTDKKVEKKDSENSDDSNPVKVVGKIDLDNLNLKTRPAKKTRKEREKERLERQKKSMPAKIESENKKEGSAKSNAKSKPDNRKKDLNKNSAKPSEKDAGAKKAVNKRIEDKPVENNDSSEEQNSGNNFIESKIEKLSGPVVVGKIDLPADKKPKSSTPKNPEKKKKRRKRIKKDKVNVNQPQDNNKSNGSRKPGGNGGSGNRRNPNAKDKSRRSDYRKHEVNEEDVQKQIKETLSRLTSKGKGKGAKHRRDKRDAVYQKSQQEIAKNEEKKNIIKVTEFVSVNELANMMNVQVNQVIATCMNLGLFVSINQRLDAETMALVADEFSYKVEFVSAEVLDAIVDDEKDEEASLVPRPPIVTVMGHVDHGKTSLLDYIRKSNIIGGEAGGITQHIGAYSVKREDGKVITFLDTPGHEAFTAMRARGAQITDVAIIIIAADDNIMPQTKEAINHAQAAGVPIVFAINKIDKEGANPEKIKEELAQMNLMVEEWGGKYQSQDISAKQGLNVEQLLEKVLLESEMLELKANPNKNAVGAIIESSLDKGRGYIATVLVQSGTLKVGDIILAGAFNGHVKAMYNERGVRIEEAGPSMPVQILGLNGAPQAGDKFNVMNSDQEAKDIANKREQLQREQGLRAQKYITLDEIGRRIAVGNFHELNVIVKGDVDGSIEALSDAIIKLSTGEIQVNVIHKAVGQISESDILLATASNAIIIGFQVRPSLAARKLAEKEEIDIRLYSIIYDAINEMRDAMEGMLSPEIKEEITGTAEVMEAFKITKVGTIAGCIVREGKINRNNKVRLIRDGIVVYSGILGSLKRFKDDVKEVSNGYECGLNIDKFNDIKVGDIIEAYHEVEIRKKL